MGFIKFQVFLAALLLGISSANAATSVTFFSSNNTGVIDTHSAYERLLGKPQDELQNSIVDIMQRNHIEQGKCRDILGTYKMSNYQNITADNTDSYTSSPLQELSQEKIIALATQLTNSLRQESVAVFIPSEQENIGDIQLHFTSHQPRISEVISLLQQKLPAGYSQAFSLHLDISHPEFNDVRVASIEWLGNKNNAEEIMKAFPDEEMTVRNGKALLVYKNGQTEEL